MDDEAPARRVEDRRVVTTRDRRRAFRQQFLPESIGQPQRPGITASALRVAPPEKNEPVARCIELEGVAFSLVEGLEIGSVSGQAFTPTGKLSLGEKLDLRNGTATALVGGEMQELLEARGESGLEGYVPSSYIARGSGLAVVVSEQAALFDTSDGSSPRPQGIAAGVVVAARADAMQSDYPAVSFVLPGTRRAFQGVYIRKADLSYRLDDVGSAILMQRAELAENPERKVELLRQALRDHPSSSFVVRIEEEIASLDAASTEAPAGEERASEPFFASLVTTEDNVDVRSSPDDAAGKVVATLAEKGTAVEVEARTTSEYQVGELTAPWYRIRDPEGWIFGAYAGVD